MWRYASNNTKNLVTFKITYVQSVSFRLLALTTVSQPEAICLLVKCLCFAENVFNYISNTSTHVTHDIE